MKILIDLQEETYNKIRRGDKLYPADANVVIFAIETGTPLEMGKWVNHKCSACEYGVMPWNDTPYCPQCGQPKEVKE